MKHQTVGLQFDLQPHKGTGLRKGALPLAGVSLLAAALLLLLPPARESLKCLCNLVFAASEAVNAYAYEYFQTAADASPIPALGLLAAALAGLLLAALVGGSRIVPLVAALILAGGEIWLGLTPPAAVNVLIFALLALLAAPMDTMRSRLAFLLAIAAIFLSVQVLAPGVRAKLEEASEHVRDRLDPVEQLVSGADHTPQQEPPQTAREENRLDTETAGEASGDAQNTQNYQHIYEQEQEISPPKGTDYLKIALLTLLILALLTLPFLPFVLFDARRRRALERRAAFDSPDCSEAIRALFLHLTAYLDSCGKGGGNQPFIQWDGTLTHTLSPEYAARFRRAAALFEEAVYSTHTMGEEQRAELRRLLTETERLLYDGADRKTKFRLKYLECLHT